MTERVKEHWKHRVIILLAVTRLAMRSGAKTFTDELSLHRGAITTVHNFVRLILWACFLTYLARSQRTVSISIRSVMCCRLRHSHNSSHCKALNSLLCADVPLRNYSLTHSSCTWELLSTVLFSYLCSTYFGGPFICGHGAHCIMLKSNQIKFIRHK